MGILLRVIRTIFFVALILALGQIKFSGKPIAEHLTSKVSGTWKTTAEPWLKKGAASIPSDTVRKWLAPPAPRRATKPRPIVDDIAERDKADLRKILERDSK